MKQNKNENENSGQKKHPARPFIRVGEFASGCHRCACLRHRHHWHQYCVCWYHDRPDVRHCSSGRVSETRAPFRCFADFDQQPILGLATQSTQSFWWWLAASIESHQWCWPARRSWWLPDSITRSNASVDGTIWSTSGRHGATTTGQHLPTKIT